MPHVHIIWDLEDDPDGNYWHIVVDGHGVTREEVDEILLSRESEDAISDSSGRPMAFGWTSAGRYIAVIREEVLEDPRTLYPVTAYPVKPPRKSRR